MKVASWFYLLSSSLSLAITYSNLKEDKIEKWLWSRFLIEFAFLILLPLSTTWLQRREEWMISQLLSCFSILVYYFEITTPLALLYLGVHGDTDKPYAMYGFQITSTNFKVYGYIAMGLTMVLLLFSMLCFCLCMECIFILVHHLLLGLLGNIVLPLYHAGHSTVENCLFALVYF